MGTGASAGTVEACSRPSPPAPRRGSHGPGSACSPCGFSTTPSCSPRPGVPVTERPLAALVPLALLALIAWAYPRLTGTARGALDAARRRPRYRHDARRRLLHPRAGLVADDVTGWLALARRPRADRARRRHAVAYSPAHGPLPRPPRRARRRRSLITAIDRRAARRHRLRAHSHRPRGRAGEPARRPVRGRDASGPPTASPSTAGTSRRATAPRSSPSPAARARRTRRGCSPATGTACCCSTAAARAAAKASPTAGAGAAAATSRARSRSCEHRGIDRIGGIGLSVGGELMLEAAAETAELDAVVSEGAGARTLGES